MIVNLSEMKKILLILFAIIIVAATSSAVLIHHNGVTRQSEVKFDAIGGSNSFPAGCFPLDSTMTVVELSRGLRFRICSASSLSAIDCATIERLKKLGCRVDSNSTVLAGRTADNGTELYHKSYTVDIPLTAYTTIDSTKELAPIEVRHGEKRFIRNVQFVEALPGESNSFGTDFLDHYVLEFLRDYNALVFNEYAPAGYEMSGSFFLRKGLREYICAGSRYYLDMKVDHVPFTFLINTGLDEVTLKIPSEHLLYRNDDTSSHKIYSDADGELDATVDRNAWCEFGNRAGGRRVYYYNDRKERFEINPQTFFNQDIVLDFRNNCLYLRPTFNIRRN